MAMFAIMMIALAVLFYRESRAQFEYSEFDATASGLGGAYVSISDKSTAVFCNPSGLGQLKSNDLSVFFSPSVYGMKEVSAAAITFSVPLGFGTMGAGIRSFGFDLYRESVLALSLGKGHGARVYWGITACLYSLAVQGYGSALTAGVDAGAMIRFSERLTGGFSVKNVTGSEISGQIARTYATGISFKPDKMLTLVVDAEMDSRFPVTVKFGAEAEPAGNVRLRAGVCSFPVSYSAGAGLSYGSFDLDYSAFILEPLGITNSFGLSIRF